MTPARFDAEARRRAPGAPLLGVDEAGRGPLAGPVVVAAVCLPEKVPSALRGVDDSKVLSAGAREALFEALREHALSVAVAWAHPPVIDRDNILRATLAAMGRAARRAAAGVEGAPLVLVDGPHRVPGLELPQEAVVDGDARSLSIAAASVVAKVVRDRWMAGLERRHPGYGFAKHKGYSTDQHLDALDRLGPCRVHRFSYEPVIRRVYEAEAARTGS